MIVEGVFAGNQGPLFYDGQEISKSVTGWNHKPITVGHPEDRSGAKVSGCTPESIEQFGVGMVLNTSWSGKTKKLRAEAWFDVVRLDTVPGGQKIKESLEKGNPVEVSTGLFVDNEVASGQWNGKEFAGKARNFRPDHLAVLLSGVGACSLADGAGLLVNKQAQADPKKPRNLPRLHEPSDLITNEESLSKFVDAVRRAVERAYSQNDPVQIAPPLEWVEVMEVYSEYVVYMQGSNYYQENFTYDGSEVKLLGNRIQVIREVSYKPIVTNQKVDMDKAQLLAALGEPHKAFVEALTEDQVAAIAGLQKEVKVEVPVANEAPKDLAGVLAVAPADVKAKIEEAFAVNENHRNGLISKISANPQNQFTGDELAGMGTAQLEKLSVLAVNSAPAAPAAAAPVYAGSAAASAPVASAPAVKGFRPPSTFASKGN
jgi:hypothetical protein